MHLADLHPTLLPAAREADALAARRWYTGEEYRVEAGLMLALRDMMRATTDEERAACKATLERVRRVMDRGVAA